MEHRLSALRQLHLHSWLNHWFQWSGQTTARRDENHFNFGIWHDLYQRFYGKYADLLHGRPLKQCFDIFIVKIGIEILYFTNSLQFKRGGTFLTKNNLSDNLTLMLAKLIEVWWCHIMLKNKIIGSDKGVLLVLHQAITWTNADLLWIVTFGININEIRIKI